MGNAQRLVLAASQCSTNQLIACCWGYCHMFSMPTSLLSQPVLMEDQPGMNAWPWGYGNLRVKRSGRPLGIHTTCFQLDTGMTFQSNQWSTWADVETNRNEKSTSSSEPSVDVSQGEEQQQERGWHQWNIEARERNSSKKEADTNGTLKPGRGTAARKRLTPMEHWSQGEEQQQEGGWHQSNI